MKTYDLVKQILTEVPETRSSDKKLMLWVWYKQGVIWPKHMGSKEISPLHIINWDTFCSNGIPAESITRARRKIQERHEELRAEKTVEHYRKQKAEEKGTHIYRERMY